MSYVHWIEVSELLPGDDGIGDTDELLFSDGKQIYFGKFEDGDFFEQLDIREDEWRIVSNVTHWFQPDLPFLKAAK